MKHENIVKFNAAGLEFGTLFVSNSDDPINPIRELAHKCGMDLGYVGNSSDNDKVWALIKHSDKTPTKGADFLRSVKDICTVENGWYTDHIKTNVLYLMFLYEDSLAETINEADIQA